MRDVQATAIVGFVWGIIIFETIAYLSLFATMFYDKNIYLFIGIVPIFCVIVGLICITYYLSIYTDPGSPPYQINSNYHDELESIKKQAKEQSQKKREKRANKDLKIQFDEIESLTKVSYCFKCDKVKEQRVHHCRVCKKCIMRMDHHCPWVGNCVGKMNHKYFILFLFYATVGLSIVWTSAVVDYCQQAYYYNLLASEVQKWQFIIMAVSSLGMSLSIGFLFVTQMYTSISNITTLQSFIPNIKAKNPWNRHSTKRNLSQIFGESNWLIPTKPFPSHSALNSFSAEQL